MLKKGQTISGIRSIYGTTAACLLALLLALFGGGEAVHGADGATIARDLPLPERWRGQFVREPVLKSRMYVIEAGRVNAPVVLLVHGLGQSGYQDWWETIHGIEVNYRVVALDLPGFGRSTTPDGELSPPRYARLLHWLTEELELEDIHVVGHSMGAAVALYYASEYPERVANVVLVDAAGILQRLAFLREVAAGQMKDPDLPSVLGNSVERLFNWGERFAETFLINSRIDPIQVLRRSNQTWNTLLTDLPTVNAAVSLLETDFSRNVDRLDLPTTIIWGSADTVTPIRTGYLLHGKLSASSLQIVEGAEHTPMRSHPQEFLHHLQQALIAPPKYREDVFGSGEKHRDLICRGKPGETISGNFNRVFLDRCPGALLVNVRARHIRVSQSPKVRMRHIRIESDSLGLLLQSSDVTATDVEIVSDPAIRVDDARLDLAGGTLLSVEAALIVERHSTIILSVTKVDSGVYTGFLHGAIQTNNRVLDRVRDLHSR